MKHNRVNQGCTKQLDVFMDKYLKDIYTILQGFGFLIGAHKTEFYMFKSGKGALITTLKNFMNSKRSVFDNIYSFYIDTPNEFVAFLTLLIAEYGKITMARVYEYGSKSKGNAIDDLNQALKNISIQLGWSMHLIEQNTLSNSSGSKIINELKHFKTEIKGFDK